MDIEEVWTKLISQLKANPHINASQIDAFFSRVQIQAASMGFVMFTSESEFIKNWLEVHYANEIKQALHDLYGVDFMVMFEVDSTQQPESTLPGGEALSGPAATMAPSAYPVGEKAAVREAPFANGSAHNLDDATDQVADQAADQVVDQAAGQAAGQATDQGITHEPEHEEAYRTNPLAPTSEDSRFVRNMPEALVSNGSQDGAAAPSQPVSEYDAYLQMLKHAHDEDARHAQSTAAGGRFAMPDSPEALVHGGGAHGSGRNEASLREMPDGIEGASARTQGAMPRSITGASGQAGRGNAHFGTPGRSDGKEFEQVARSVLGDHANPYASNAPSLTFDTFVIGNSNRMAYAMAQEVAERPGVTNLNPLFIYGRSGVGKTHLLCSIKNYINEQYPEMNVCYIDSMELVNLYSEASRERSVDKRSFKNFEAFFEAADVLLIDDIQGLQGKPGTLDAVFRIFNNMIAQNKQMVFAADRAPKNIDLDERYSSRFNQGAEIDIQPPDDETKRSIVVSYLRQCQEEEHFDIDLSDDVINYIVERSSFNVRELRSAVNKVVFAMRMNGGEGLSAQKVKELISNHFITEGSRRVTVEAVQHAVESFYQISHADLVSKKRNKEIKHARQVAIYLIRDLIEGTTYKAIGKMFNRDHSTIMHSYDVVSKGLKDDRNLREEVEAIREKIRIEEV